MPVACQFPGMFLLQLVQDLHTQFVHPFHLHLYPPFKGTILNKIAPGAMILFKLFTFLLSVPENYTVKSMY